MWWIGQPKRQNKKKKNLVLQKRRVAFVCGQKEEEEMSFKLGIEKL
jgi:hypothetical protein